MTENRKPFRLPTHDLPTTCKYKHAMSNAHRPFVETLWYHESRAVVKTIREADGKIINIYERHWGRQATCAKCRREKRNPGEFHHNDLTGKGAAIVLGGVMTLFFAVIITLLVWNP